MKKVTITAALLIALGSCTKSDTTLSLKSNTVNTVKPNLMKRIQESGYKGQLPYYTISDMDRLQEYDVEHHWEANANNPAVTWELLDAQFSPELANEVQQQFAFTILVRKDLIGLAQADPGNADYQMALKKYVAVLVAQKYCGFTVLYEALTSITDPAFRNANANVVAAYGKADDFHKTSLENPDLNDSPYRVKIAEDFGYLERIGEILR